MTSEQEKIPQEFWQGIAEFNQQEFYKCHDTLEALWMEAGEPERTFYQGVLQIAVGLYHAGNENWRGAVMLLGEGIRKLNYYLPTYFEIDVDKLLTESTELLKNLQESGPENIADFVRSSDNTKYPKILKLES
ncbi:MAG: DUF309 domain-containing protein [Okeania sp. SIO2C9]|uniref:DUF309 domain-containing protein n=1 Tax=Okeania sp. SIO2C9 TaxID=2607791 RepID=UPI0013BF91E9|nr:DUF309 domain-containing protein [Okeania sp. SIO2C9]NEQ73229.1 DUF309 domain-containing protein [Okeania sp. SIO2C9]